MAIPAQCLIHFTWQFFSISFLIFDLSSVDSVNGMAIKRKEDERLSEKIRTL